MTATDSTKVGAPDGSALALFRADVQRALRAATGLGLDDLAEVAPGADRDGLLSEFGMCGGASAVAIADQIADTLRLCRDEAHGSAELLRDFNIRQAALWSYVTSSGGPWAIDDEGAARGPEGVAIRVGFVPPGPGLVAEPVYVCSSPAMPAPVVRADIGDAVAFGLGEHDAGMALRRAAGAEAPRQDATCPRF